ncbi:MAG: hypothetical protein R3D67_11885 [Hyphomicrobiaceae bacterium]
MRPLRWLLALGLAGLLAWLVIAHTFVAYLASGDPKRALQINPRAPVALLNVAEEIVVGEENRRRDAGTATAQTSIPDPTVARFSPAVKGLAPEAASAAKAGGDTPAGDSGGQPQADDLGHARKLIEIALVQAPLSARGWTLLGRIAQLEAAPDERAEAPRPYFTLAARMSLRESRAIYWLLGRSVARSDYASAVKYADQLLRTNSRSATLVVPVLTQLVELPEARDAVLAALATDPPWRRLFFSSMLGQIRDARTPLDIMLAAQKAGRPPTPDELAGYMQFLIGRNFYQLAYYTWLQFLTEDQLASTGLLFNGSFESPFSGYPFDWSVSSGAGTRVERAPIPEHNGRRALRVDFVSGRVQFGGVSQVVLLSPGQHVLKGRYRGELDGKRGLRWRVRCMAAPARKLGETDMQFGPMPMWHDFELRFEVPSEGCDAQQIRLDLDARSSSEQLVRGTMWYDELVIQRLTERAGIDRTGGQNVSR